MNKQPADVISNQRFAAVFALAIGAAALLQISGALASWDRLLNDFMMGMRQRMAPADIVIIGIDEQSLSDLGRWPWSRQLHARLLDRLTDAGSKAVGYDVMFAEPDASNSDADAALIEAVRRNGRTILPVFPEHRSDKAVLVETRPLPQLAAVAAQLGHVDVDLDADAVSRSVYLKAGIEQPVFSALPLAMLEIGSGSAWKVLPGARRPRAEVARPGMWSRDYRLQIPFAGPPGRFRQVSFADVLRDDDVAKSMHDKYVLVGVTATGLGSNFATPVSAQARPMSGVEFNANVLDTLRRGIGVTPLRGLTTAALTAVVLLLACIAYWRAGDRYGWMIALATAVCALALSVAMLFVAHLWYAPMTLLTVSLLGGATWAVHRIVDSSWKLRMQEERTRALLNSIGESVIATDRDGTVTYLNPAAASMLNIPADVAQGRILADLLQESTGQAKSKILTLIEQCLAQGQTRQLPESIELNGGELKRAVSVTASPIQLGANNSSGVVIAMSDVTESIAANARMVHQATHDALTELPNRVLLQDRLNHAISNAQRNDTWVGVIFLDLDGFKRVNDGLGHSVGDALLMQVARRLRLSMREQDTVARWGGDEFVFILEGMTRREIVAQLADKILKCFRKPFRFDNHELYVTASIGISLCPRDGNTAEELLKKADTAMYRVKDHGRNGFRFYSDDINSWTVQNLELEQNLHRAIKRGELELYFQPQVTLPSGEIVGLEALLRWNHPEEGLIPPSRFIPIAEENGLIHAIGDMVINAACRQAREWADQGKLAIPISINVSPRQFARREIARVLGNAIRTNAINPGLIKVEITESTIVQDVKKTLSALRDFKALGVRIAIDDFGTGFSSLTHLKRFPIDELKIDQSFVRDITNDPDDAAIALAVIALARSMNLTVIAEGVETDAQVVFLREHQCNNMQGYYFGHPRPAGEMTKLLQ